MRKNVPLQSRIDRIIQNAFEGGLFEKRYGDTQQKRIATRYEVPLEIPFNLEQYSFALVSIYGSGVIMSTLAFCCELLIKRIMMQMKRLRIWNYVEQFFDGQRHYLKDVVEELMKSRK